MKPYHLVTMHKMDRNLDKILSTKYAIYKDNKPYLMEVKGQHLSRANARRIVMLLNNEW